MFKRFYRKYICEKIRFLTQLFNYHLNITEIFKTENSKYDVLFYVQDF